jgi:putative transposase
LIEEYFYVSNERGGRPLKHSKREILDAIFYVLRTGCQWRYLPHDFPPWKTVYEQFRRWTKQGIFESMSFALVKYSRMKLGRNGEPSAGIVDSQSVKTTEKGALKGTMVGRKLRGERGISL